jgi:hypothetical protein
MAISMMSGTCEPDSAASVTASSAGHVVASAASGSRMLPR